jgi:hypothetical protein
MWQVHHRFCIICVFWTNIIYAKTLTLTKKAPLAMEYLYYTNFEQINNKSDNDRHEVQFTAWRWHWLWCWYSHFLKCHQRIFRTSSFIQQLPQSQITWIPREPQYPELGPPLSRKWVCPSPRNHSGVPITTTGEKHSVYFVALTRCEHNLKLFFMCLSAD